MTPTQSNPVTITNEIEFYAIEKHNNCQNLKVGLIIVACIYTLGLTAIIGVGMEKSHSDCSTLKNDAFFRCKKFEKNLQTIYDCLLISLVTPIILAVGVGICLISHKYGGCEKNSVTMC